MVVLVVSALGLLIAPTAPAFGASVGHEYRSQLTEVPLSASLSGPFVAPYAVAVDSHNNVWVLDRGKGVIDEFDSAGIFVSQQTGEGHFQEGGARIESIAIAPSSGDLYVAESYEDVVDVFEPGGKFMEAWNGSGAPQKSFGRGKGKGSYTTVAIDPSTGQVYVDDAEQGVVDKFTAAGEYQSQLSLPFADGVSMAASGGNLYVIDGGVKEYNSFGEPVISFEGGETPVGSFYNFPTDEKVFEGITPRSGIAVASTGDIYVADTGHKVIDEFDSSGKYLGQVNGGETPAHHLMEPDGVAVNSSGDLYVADYDPNTNSAGVVDMFSSEVTQYALTVSVTGGAGEAAGQGADSSVSSSPAGIFETQPCYPPHGTVDIDQPGACHSPEEQKNEVEGTDCEYICSAQFDPGTKVTLTERPVTGFEFVRWIGCETESGPGKEECTVTMSGAKSVTAEFEALPQYVLEVKKTGSGAGTVTSVPLGIECGLVCSYPFNKGEVITLTEEPEPGTGSKFVGWIGCETESGPGKEKCTVTMAEAKSVTADFEPVAQYVLEVDKVGSGAGTVTSVPLGIECGLICSYPFNADEVVTLTEEPGSTSTFVKWIGCETESGPGKEKCTMTMTKAKKVTAEFEAIPQETLTVARTGSGAGRVTSLSPGIDCGATCSHVYNQDARVVLTETPGATSTFAGWLGGGCSDAGTCEVSMSESLEVTAVFEAVVQGACPNEQLRSEQPYGLRLPDCRAYEMVSPLDKNDSNAVILGEEQYVRASLSGEAITYDSLGSFATPTGSEFDSQYLSRRGADGWSTSNITPPYEPFATEELSPDPELIYTPELSSGLALTDVLLTSEATPGYLNLYFTDFAEGSYQLLTSAVAGVTLPPPYGVNISESRGPLPVGASTDLSRVVFVMQEPRDEWYEWVDGKAYRVNIAPNGASMSVQGAHNELAGLWRAVSDNGLRIFMTSKTTGQVYVRENPEQPQSGLNAKGECTDPSDACTVEVSASQRTIANPHGPRPAAYVGGSVDGSRAFFISRAELTEDADTGPADNAANLYEYDLEEHRLTDLTVDTKDTDGAGVLGVSDIGEDGSYVYFVAEGELAAGAVAGQPNLYVDHDGTIALIATLGGGGVNAPTSPSMVRATPDGTHLAFLSSSSLTGYDNEQAEPGECEGPGEAGKCREVYVYDASTGVLACASCDPSGARPLGPAGFGDEHPGNAERFVSYIPRNFSEDGDRLFFQSKDALVPKASNGLQNVYEYEDGQVYPISDVAGGHESSFLDASASGNDVFIATADQLVPEDTDYRMDVYDARVGGGYPVSVSPPECDNADACKAPVSPQPSIYGAPPSATFSGPGNPVPAVAPPPPKKATKKAVKCKKPKKLARGKCVKPKKAKKAKKARRVISDRRAS